jgi:hypothetical protein
MEPIIQAAITVKPQTISVMVNVKGRELEVAKSTVILV